MSGTFGRIRSEIAAMRTRIRAAGALVLVAAGAFFPAWAREVVRAEGEFTVRIDFATLVLTPVDEHCLIVVEGIVDFTGTLDGIATARTRALATASCEEVAVLPPGAYEDVFTSAFEFAGKIAGRPVVADIVYRGDTAIGGGIDALFILSSGLEGVLTVDATVAVGGTYQGRLKLGDR